MCLYPKLIKNPKYLPNKTNGFNPPKCEDERTMYVPIGCGNCIECKRKIANEWKVRLNEELKITEGKFVTLTFSEDKLKELCEKIKKEKGFNARNIDIDSNVVAARGVKDFLNRWRKTEKKSPRHWLITELGHNNTERIHIHGIIFTDKNNEVIQKNG